MIVALVFGGYQVYRLMTRGGDAGTAMEYEVVVYRCSLCILEWPRLLPNTSVIPPIKTKDARPKTEYF